MPDELSSASTGGASTPSDVGGSSATAGDAGQSTTQPSAPQTPPTPETPAAPDFDAGWSLDEDAAETPLVPDTDDDIPSMLTDPALDQQRVPGVVQALKTARGAVRERDATIKQLQSQIAQFQQFGGVDGVNQLLALGVGNLMSNPQQGAAEFVNQIGEQSMPALQGLADVLVQQEHEYLVRALQRAGKLPEAPQSRPGSYDAEILSALPEHLKDVYKNADPEMRDELDLMSDARRNAFLQREHDFSQLQQGQRQQAERAWKAQVQQAEQAGVKAFEDLSSQLERANVAQLSKWQPLGPDDAQGNQDLYSMVQEWAFSRLLSKEYEGGKWATLYRDAQHEMTGAPLRRLDNEGYAADTDERSARGKAAQFNARLGQVMKGMVRKLDSAFRDARAYRDGQRKTIPQRTEIAGGSSSATNGNGISPIDPKTGKTNPAWYRDMLQTLPKG